MAVTRYSPQALLLAEGCAGSGTEKCKTMAPSWLCISIRVSRPAGFHLTVTASGPATSKARRCPLVRTVMAMVRTPLGVKCVLMLCNGWKWLSSRASLPSRRSILTEMPWTWLVSQLQSACQ